MSKAEHAGRFLSTWKRKLLVVLVVAIMCLALALRFLSGVISSILTSVVVTVASTATLLGIPIMAASSILALVIVARREADRRGWLLPKRRTEKVIASERGNSGDILLVNRDRGEEYAILMLKLLSVPSQGVRQRVRGAVSREEQEDGAAVSDERQCQFSHLASLYQSQQRAGLVGKKGEVGVSYEIHFEQGLANVGFTISARNIAECESIREQVKASIVSKFPVEVVEENGERLKQASFMRFLSSETDNAWDRFEGTSFQLSALSGKVSHVATMGFQSYVVVVALVGRPEMSAYEQRCQIDQLIAGTSKIAKNADPNSNSTRGKEGKGGIEDVDMNFIVSFRTATPPNYPSDAPLRKKLRDKPDVKTSLERKRVEVDAMEVEFGHRVGWWKVSTYVIVAGGSPALVELRAEAVANTLASVWSGSHFAPRCLFLRSKEVVSSFRSILRRELLPRKYVTEMSSMRLSSLVHLPEEPHPPLTRVTAPLFEAPEPSTLTTGNRSGSGCIEFGDVLGPSGVALYFLTLPLDGLSKHVTVFGESGSGRTCFVLNLLHELQLAGSVPFLVLDQKGEYRCLLSSTEASIIYFLPASKHAPLWINLFDPQSDDPDTHTKYIFNIIREILFANRTELTPQMERVLYDVLRMNVGGNWTTFNEKLSEFLEIHGDELPQLGATIQGILNRVGQFTRPPLSYVFNCNNSNVNFSYLVERNVIIDLSELRRAGTPEDVRLLANIVAKYVSAASLRRGADYRGKLKHLFVVDDALEVVPEILARKTTAEVGIIEHMAILLRATGQGLIVVSQRPNVSQNVIGNSATKVFFRSVVDSREVAAWINLNKEQQSYLKVLPKQEAIITVEQCATPLRIKARDVSNMLRAKVTAEDIIRNNMVQYPVMYDMQRKEMPARQEKQVEQDEERKKEGDGEGEITAQGQGWGQKEGRGTGCAQGGTVGEADQGEVESWERQGVSKLSPEDREAWYKLRGYLARGAVVDSDFASKMLGVSQPAAHRKMLSLRSAGLIGVAKVPNYAYGEGYQYVYYSQNKTVYGGGVVGYVRERIHDDLMGREAVASLSPKDVPSADMVVQNSYPLIIHVTSSSGSQGSRLSALNERIRKVADEFNMMEGLHTGSGTGFATSPVIVVTLWKQVAEELNKARQEGKLKGCLCVIPFAKRCVDTLADYALHHITLQPLLGEKDKEEVQQEEKKAKGGEGAEEKSENGCGEQKGLGKERVIIGEGECSSIKERVLATVKEFGGVEPHVVADRIGVQLWGISKVAGELKREGLIRVAKNLPYVTSLAKANATYYVDAQRQTALHDTLMNIVWNRNAELGGKCRDYAFDYGRKTWCTDGLLENTGGSFILEVVAGGYNKHVIEQLEAYSSKVGYMGIKGIIVVVLESDCLFRIREEVTRSATKLGVALTTSLRPKDEKLQLTSLLLGGSTASYHKNPHVSKGRNA